MDSYKTILSYYDIQCTPASIAPFVNISACVNMKNMVFVFFSPLTVSPPIYHSQKNQVDRCERWMKKACFDHFDFIDCSTAYGSCESATLGPFFDTGKFYQ